MIKTKGMAVVLGGLAATIAAVSPGFAADDKGKTGAAPQLVAYKVMEGPTVKTIKQSLTGKPGDPARGENLIAGRKKGNCFACHEIGKLMAKAAANPKKYSDMGGIGPRLDGIGSRYTPGELRMLLVNSKEVFPETIMPAFYRNSGLNRVMGKFKGKTILQPQEVEDILAYLVTLKEPQRTAKASPGTVPGTKPPASKGILKYAIVEGPTVNAINTALTASAGDPVRGEDLIAGRKKGNCFACHEVGPLMAKAAANPKKYSDMGNIGPRLDGVAARYTKGELRMLLVDAKQVFPETIMPAFMRKKGLHRVKKPFNDKTILNPQEVEDILAFLMQLNVEPTAGMGGMSGLTETDTSDPALGDTK
jgi:sulfur-oxidizing protein SoxX